MSSMFFGLEIAKSALAVSQRSLTLTGHNIANANTTGYTRQRILQHAIDPSFAPSRIAVDKRASVGGGVETCVIDQIRSEYIDRQYRGENASLGYWTTRTEELYYIETILDELSDSSVSASMRDFFNSISELSMDPVNEEIRTNVQQNALKMIETFKHYYTTLTDLQSTYNESMDITVQDINDLLTNISNYNKQIFAYELSGQKANDLRDKRNVLLDQLSGLVGITYEENTDGHMVVSCEGVELINHVTVTYLETQPVLEGVVSQTPGFYEIYYEGTTTPFNYSSGQLHAYKDLRDGNTPGEIGVPYVLESINTLARYMAEVFNDVHSDGYSMPFGSEPSQTGINFFDVPAGGYGDITAGTLALSSQILENVNYIAASSVPIDPNADNPQKGNNVIALALSALSTRLDIPGVGNFENYLKSTIVEIAIDSSTSQKMMYSQQTIMDNLEERRQSVSGVSLDEEMVQMITYQHAYAAASRALTALDEALDVLINRTGLVGR